MKIEHKKIFCDPSKILRNVSWLINIRLKCPMTPRPSGPPSYILNVRSIKWVKYISQFDDSFIKSYDEESDEG